MKFSYLALVQDKNLRAFYRQIHAVQFMYKPRKRKIEILPSGVGDFPILYSPGVRFYISLSHNVVSSTPKAEGM